MKIILSNLRGVKDNLLAILIILTIIFIFRGWITFLPLSTGDWVFNFPQMLEQSGLYPYAWVNNLNYGLGGNGIFILPLDTFYHLTNTILFRIGIPWALIEKIIWYWPFILVSIFGSFIFFKKFFINSNNLAAISSLIFTANTYVFMVTGGGQMAVAMSYAFIPLVFYGFLNVLESMGARKAYFKVSIIAGIFFSIQLFYDLRIAYATLVFIFLYYMLFVLMSGLSVLRKSFIPFFVIPGLVTFLLHFFWIVPFVIAGRNPLAELGAQYSTTGIVEFLSFAKFENTISLLHPNWPENLFGKIYFMRTEFIIIPILAFLPLLFVKEDKYKKNILLFSLLGLVSAFLAKGTNEPFGSIYSWSFNVLPGFQMFRDPTKWYVVTIFSFSTLIPFSLYCISNLKKKTKLLNVLIIVFVTYWLITVRFAVTGSLTGTFAPKPSPSEYFELATFLNNQDRFFRTMWVPLSHQYSYSTNKNAVIPAGDFLNQYSPKPLASKIEKNLNNLSLAGIKYIIIPEDVYGKIFTDDRRYSEKVYQDFLISTSKIKGLKKVKRFGKIVVFEVPNAKDLIFSQDDNVDINSRVISQVGYVADIKKAKAGDRIILSQNYDPLWKAKIGNVQLKNEKYNLFDKRGLNSFIMPTSGDSKIKFYYDGQKWINYGLIVSFLSGLLIIVLLFINKKK